MARTEFEETENVLAGGGSRYAGEGHARNRRVLFVDDHALFRQILAVICGQHTSLDENVQAGSLAEARRVLSSRNGNEFALAIVDLDLPDKGGVELIRELRRDGIPVLALSSSRGYERLAGLSGLGQSEVLSTTSSYDEVLDAIRRLVDV